MSGLVLIFICMLAGFLLVQCGVLDRSASRGINTFIIYLALPAVSFKYLPFVHWDKSSLILILGPVIVWLTAWMFVSVLDKMLKFTPTMRAGLLLVTGLCNTSFVGFPLIMAYFGEKQISLAVLCDQVTFLLLSTFGIYSVLKARSAGKVNPMELVRKVLVFPPFLGSAAALIMARFTDLSPVMPVVSALAATVAPLALFSIGLQLRPQFFRTIRKETLIAVVVKLLIVPAVVFLVVQCFSTTLMAGKITVFEAAMPTLLSSSIIAEEYDVEPDFVNGTVTVTILIGFLTTALWYLVLQ